MQCYRARYVIKEFKGTFTLIHTLYTHTHTVYGKLKEETLDRSRWITRCGRCYGPVVRQWWMMTQYMYNRALCRYINVCTYVHRQLKSLHPLCWWYGYWSAWQGVRSRSPIFLAVSFTQPTKLLIVWVRERCSLFVPTPPPPTLLTLVNHNNPCEIFITNVCTSCRVYLAIKRKVSIRFDRYVFYRSFLKSSAVLVLRFLKDHNFFIF